MGPRNDLLGLSCTESVEAEELETGGSLWKSTLWGINGVSADGRLLAIYQPFTPLLEIYQIPGFERLAKMEQSAHISDFQFSPGGDELAVDSPWGLEFWSTSTWQRTRAVPGFRRMLYTKDPHTWWLTKDAFTAGLYDARTLEPLLMLPARMLPLALSPDGKQLAVSVDSCRLQLWNLEELRHQLRDHELGWDEAVRHVGGAQANR